MAQRSQRPPDIFDDDEDEYSSSKPPDILDEVEEAKPSRIRQIWDKISQPLTTAPSRFASSVANVIDDPTRAENRGTIRPFLAGAVQGVGDVVSGFTSPIDLAATVTGAGAISAANRGLKSANTLRRTTQALSAPVAAHGVGSALSPDSTMQERFMGVAELAGGAAGMHFPLQTKGINRLDSSKKTNISDELRNIEDSNRIIEDTPEVKTKDQAYEDASSIIKEDNRARKITKARKIAESKGEVLPESLARPKDILDSDIKNQVDDFKQRMVNQQVEDNISVRGTPQDIPDNPAAREFEAARIENAPFINPFEKKSDRLAKLAESSKGADILELIEQSKGSPLINPGKGTYVDEVNTVFKQEAKKQNTPTATFLGWQEDAKGGAFPLYNIKGGKLNNSTVGLTDLNKQGIKVPETPPFKNPSEETPQFARSEQGGIKIGQDVRRSAQELTTGYSNPLEGIMVREAGQNAIDAVRHLGKDGNIGIKIGNDHIQISDNGKGMTRQQLETVFSDLHSSGKTGEVGSTGGKGVGKASYVLGGSKFKAETVVFEGGKKIKRTIEGTPDEFMENVNIHEEEVPLQTPTGTTIHTQFKEGQDPYQSRQMLGKILKDTRGVDANIKVRQYGDKEDYEEAYTFQGRTDDKLIEKTTIDDNEIQLSIPSDSLADLKPRTYIEVSYLNNGMFQFSKYFHLPEEAPKMPSRLLVDIHPLMEEGSPNYPFPVQRESIKEGLEGQIQELIKSRLVNPLISGKKMKLKELYESMTEMTSSTIRRGVLFDPGNRLTKPELESIKNSKVMNQLIHHYDTMIDDILVKIDNKLWSDRLEGVGIIFDENMHGVHIPNPITKRSTILINPFEYIGSKKPQEAALENVVTVLHEAAHIGSESPMSAPAITAEELSDPRIGRYLESYLSQVMSQGGLDMGHGMGFIKRLGEIYAKFGARRSLSAADQIQEIISDASGGYNPEVQRLLQVYQDSRGRDAVTEDFLSGTGVKSKVTGGRKEDIPPSNKSDGKRVTVQSAVDKLFNSMGTISEKRLEQDLINKSERARRFASFESVKGEGEKWFNTAASKMKGEFEKVDLDALQMNEAEVNSLFSAVKAARITTPEKLRAGMTLKKILNGESLPQRNELALLDSVFGNNFSARIIEMHGGLGGASFKLTKLLNTMKALKSSMDLSAPFRQGIGLIHRKEWRDATTEMYKYFGNKEYYESAMKEIHDSPEYLLGREAGLFVAEPKNLIDTEEAFMDNYIPKFLMEGKLGGVGASERAYVGMLNKLRHDTFNSMINQAKSLGHDAFTVEVAKNGTKSTIPTASTRAIARYINYATGRGGLGKLTPVANELNALLWSPRLITSRLGMLTNPKIYSDMPKGMRVEAAKSLLNLGVMYATIAGLSAIGVGTATHNVLSSDFGKLRRGGTTVDPYGGFQQPIVAAARFIQEMAETAGAKPQPETENLNPLTTAGRFGKSKESPFANLVHTLLTAKSFTGGGDFTDQYNNKTSVQESVVRSFAPMFLESIYDALQNDPKLVETVGFGAANLHGVGIQDYPERKSQPRMRMNPMSQQQLQP